MTRPGASATAHPRGVSEHGGRGTVHGDTRLTTTRDMHCAGNYQIHMNARTDAHHRDGRTDQYPVAACDVASPRESHPIDPATMWRITPPLWYPMKRFSIHPFRAPHGRATRPSHRARSKTLSFDRRRSLPPRGCHRTVDMSKLMAVPRGVPGLTAMPPRPVGRLMRPPTNESEERPQARQHVRRRQGALCSCSRGR